MPVVSDDYQQEWVYSFSLLPSDSMKKSHPNAAYCLNAALSRTDNVLTEQEFSDLVKDFKECEFDVVEAERVLYSQPEPIVT